MPRKVCLEPPLRLLSHGRLRTAAYFHRTFTVATSLETPVNSHAAPAVTSTLVYSSLGNSHLDYSRGWAWQHLLLSRRLSLRRLKQEHDDPDVVLLLEHAPVYTLGRGADENNLTFCNDGRYAGVRERLARSCRGIGSARLSIDNDRVLSEAQMHALSDVEAIDRLSSIATPVIAPNGAKIYRVERGGEVTFHGPGQLVVYPLIDLQRVPFKSDLHWYLREIEEVIILTLADYGIEGKRDEENTGVWVGDEKIAAVGVSASRWITTHGFALNVCPDLSFFDTSFILPCGIEGKGVTSVQKILKQRGADAPSVPEVAMVVLEKLQEVFRIEHIRTGITVQ